MKTLIDALKGLRDQMRSHKHSDSHEEAAYCRGFNDAGEGWSADLERIIAEHERSSDWNPIETAPKDGTRVLLWVTNSDRPKTKHGSYDSYYRAFLSDDRLICLDATHWQPLPKGPA